MCMQYIEVNSLTCEDIKLYTEYNENQLYRFNEEIKNFLGYSLCSDKNIYVLANYQNKKTTIPLPNEIKNILISNLPVNATKNTLTLAGYQIVVVEI